MARIIEASSPDYLRALMGEPFATEVTVYDADDPIDAGQRFVQAVATVHAGTVTMDLTLPNWADLNDALTEEANGETVKFVLALGDLNPEAYGRARDMVVTRIGERAAAESPEVDRMLMDPAENPYADVLAQFDLWRNERGDLSPEVYSSTRVPEWTDSDTEGCDLAQRLADSLRTLLAEHTALLLAAERTADTLSECAYDVGEHFTCSEAESIAAFMQAAGKDEDADLWIRGHATGDDEGDEHYTGDTDDDEDDDL